MNMTRLLAAITHAGRRRMQVPIFGSKCGRVRGPQSGKSRKEECAEI